MADVDPSPGPPGESEHARLGALAGFLDRLAGSARYVGYAHAERDCEALAAALLARYSRADLQRFSYLPIPRGGLIVLGMLSYLLDLAPERLAVGRPPDGPVVVVDDCALTGARLAATLQTVPETDVVVAHLYSHPDLRRAVRRREPRVTGCVAAHDLRDLAPEAYPDPEDLRRWRRRWRRRLGPGRYWHGQPELVAFAWTEPDRPFWNPATERVEDAWRLVPPHLCLKNRARLGPPSDRPGRAVWRVPLGLAYGDFDGLLWLCRPDGGGTYLLEGLGADVWRGLARWGDPAAASAALAAAYEVDAAAARADVDAFASRLAAAGLLERSDDGAGG